MNWVGVGLGNGLSPIRHQAITWTIAGLSSIGLLGTNFSEIRIRIPSFSFKKMHLKLSSAKMAAILSRGRWVQKDWDDVMLSLHSRWLLSSGHVYSSPSSPAAPGQRSRWQNSGFHSNRWVPSTTNDQLLFERVGHERGVKWRNVFNVKCRR